MDLRLDQQFSAACTCTGSIGTTARPAVSRAPLSSSTSTLGCRFYPFSNATVTSWVRFLRND
jgi:hypothetical protein